MQKSLNSELTAVIAPIERFMHQTGPKAANNPQRQGLSADLNDGARPNNVLGESRQSRSITSPAWDA